LKYGNASDCPSSSWLKHKIYDGRINERNGHHFGSLAIVYSIAQMMLGKGSSDVFYTNIQIPFEYVATEKHRDGQRDINANKWERERECSVSVQVVNQKGRAP